MKNYWLKKNEKKNFETILIDKIWGYPEFRGYKTPNQHVFKEIPKENKVHVFQTYKCPITGVKHNFKSL